MMPIGEEALKLLARGRQSNWQVTAYILSGMNIFQSCIPRELIFSRVATKLWMNQNYGMSPRI